MVRIFPLPLLFTKSSKNGSLPLDYLIGNFREIMNTVQVFEKKSNSVLPMGPYHKANISLRFAPAHLHSPLNCDHSFRCFHEQKKHWYTWISRIIRNDHNLYNDSNHQHKTCNRKPKRYVMNVNRTGSRTFST